MKKYLLIILTAISYGLIIQYEINNYQPDGWFVFDFFKPAIFYLLGLIISLIAIAKSITRFKRTKKKFHLTPTIIVITGILFLIGIQISKTINEKEPIISAHYDGGTNGLRLSLYADNSYELHDYSYIGGTFHHGNYARNRDTIILEHKYPIRPNNEFIEDTLIISNNRILFYQDSSGYYDTAIYVMLIKSK